MTREYLQTDIARHVWRSRYRFGDELDICDTWRRVAHAVASVEADGFEIREMEFFELLNGLRFLPGGRILAGAGTPHDVTLMNCFVMGSLEDSIEGIFSALQEGARTMRMGGGIGYDFSTLRPAGSPVAGTGAIASGPVSFMHIWDKMCATLLSTGTRRGAMMATLRCDHPDILQFVDAKRDPESLRNFNLSVQVTDDFMAAVAEDEDWPLVFSIQDGSGNSGNTLPSRHRSASNTMRPYRIVKMIRAAELWGKIIRAAYDVAEPGVLFIDTINRENNLRYCEQLTATNPCGELPLPAYGCCDLGSINLTAFVLQPFTADAVMDNEGVRNAVVTGVRFLDNVIELSAYPLLQQAAQARNTRRIGLGITGLADTLAMLGLHYDSDTAREYAAKLMRDICHTAYRASIDLAQEKGPFPAFVAEDYLQSEFARRLPRSIRGGIRKHGIRNSHVTAIAPAGTISLLANNVSSGIEPINALKSERKVLAANGSRSVFHIEDFAARLYRDMHPGHSIPDTLVTSSGLSPDAHLSMQAALQQNVDSAISKTVHVAADFPFREFRELYNVAWKVGLKGCTAFRPNPVTGSVIAAEDLPPIGVQCCDIEREGD